MTIASTEDGAESIPSSSSDVNIENPEEPAQAMDIENAHIEVNGDDGDDDVTVIILEQVTGTENHSSWADENSPEMEERKLQHISAFVQSWRCGRFFSSYSRSSHNTPGRRNVLLRELQRVQKTSFIHFLILCLIPTSLLFIVLATVLGEDEDCESLATTCELEPRTFINAFTTRCVCDAITIVSSSIGDP